MSQLFAGWTEKKFYKLAEDISASRASALMRIQTRIGSGAYFEAQIMPSLTGAGYTLLNTVAFTPGAAQVLIVTWSYEGDDMTVDSVMRAWINGQWGPVNDDFIKTMTGQESFDLIITRIEEE